MRALRLCVKGSFNSFRLPQEMRYQSTYMYPPKTTVIGLVGAALGLEDKKLEKIYDKILIGIILDGMGGKARDLWRIRKLKRTSEEKAVVIREMLYNPVYWFYFSFVSKEFNLEMLKEAFHNPVYPLTLGRSDELILVDSLDVVELCKAEKNVHYKWTVLPFDYKDKNYKFEEVDLSEPFSVPQVFKIPTGFEYSKGRRVPKNEKKFTHIFDIGLKFEDCAGWKDCDKCFFMF